LRPQLRNDGLLFGDQFEAIDVSHGSIAEVADPLVP